MPQEHIVKIYDDELANLDRLIAEMGGEVENLLSDAVQSLVQYDAILSAEVIVRDKRIDALEMEIVAQATRLLALRQPMAADLRTIVASLRLVNDLERMGDYAKNISKRVKTLVKTPLLSAQHASVKRMCKLVGEMIRQVLDAYLQRDIKQAVSVIEQDEGVDLLYTSMFRETLTYMMEDPRNISACTHFLFIAKNIERIGDHATNIAEQVYYIVEGKQFEEGHINHDLSADVIRDTGEEA
ncbi:MAG: phosphate signaling complex protein PhoU [Kordiimonadaceae bacterium]|nr:phosphate signaling complex protein PhoU [Kordiimonadaceae bacterium]